MNVVLLSDATFKQNLAQMWQMVNKINAISKFKGCVQSVILCMHTRSKSSTPLINSCINCRLINAAPDFNQPLLQLYLFYNIQLEWHCIA